MGYPPFPVALVHTQMLGGGGRGRPGYAQKTRARIYQASQSAILVLSVENS